MKFEHRRFPLQGGHQDWLHSVQGGNPEGHPLLCLHGATGNWTNYRPLLKYLVHDHAIWAADMRGHGRSPWADPCSINDFYRDLERFAEGLPKPFRLCAHSFGGYFGVRMAAEHPDWVSHLVVFNSASTIPRGLPFRLLRWTCPILDLISRPEGVISSGSRVTAHLMDHVLQHWDLDPYYSRVECPTLVVLGALDPLIPVAHARRCGERFANGRVQVFPLGMHVAMWERPALIHRWMRELFSVSHRDGQSRPALTGPS